MHNRKEEVFQITFYSITADKFVTYTYISVCLCVCKNMCICVRACVRAWIYPPLITKMLSERLPLLCYASAVSVLGWCHLPSTSYSPASPMQVNRRERGREREREEDRDRAGLQGVKTAVNWWLSWRCLLIVLKFTRGSSFARWVRG